MLVGGWGGKDGDVEVSPSYAHGNRSRSRTEFTLV